MSAENYNPPAGTLAADMSCTPRHPMSAPQADDFAPLRRLLADMAPAPETPTPPKCSALGDKGWSCSLPFDHDRDHIAYHLHLSDGDILDRWPVASGSPSVPATEPTDAYLNWQRYAAAEGRVAELEATVSRLRAESKALAAAINTAIAHLGDLMGRNDDLGDLDEIESIQDALFASLTETPTPENDR